MEQSNPKSPEIIAAEKMELAEALARNGHPGIEITHHAASDGDSELFQFSVLEASIEFTKVEQTWRGVTYPDTGRQTGKKIDNPIGPHQFEGDTLDEVVRSALKFAVDLEPRG